MDKIYETNLFSCEGKYGNSAVEENLNFYFSAVFW